ncbi:hypothetical protein FACS189490_10650 [Clostridia bacterium]|nr:hypothetical protein FACS189490_10650 [Clostridia bacterium]
MEYTLTRSKRKTIALYVRNGAVEVRAPLRVAKAEINRFAESKQAWIEKRLTQSVEFAESRTAFTVNFGDTVTYRGKEYRVVGVPGKKICFDDCFCLPANLPPEQVKSACAQLYRFLAKRDLTTKTLEFAAKMGVRPTAVKINGAVTRWGSCSAKKSINFSWRLIMADDDVIDDVVVHELAHIIEMNHSSRFWAIVGDVLPDYKERREKLRVLQAKLNAEEWE